MAALIVTTAASLAAESHLPAVFDLDRDREPVVVLDGSWRFHTGDDARWADPGFDDSHWAVLNGKDGWSSQGYPGLSGFGWYRARLLLPSGAQPQTLLIPQGAILSNYQVFADGKPVSGCSWPGITAVVVQGQVLCPLTRSETAHTRTLLLAIRVWHWPVWASLQPGGIQDVLRVGDATQIREFAELQTSQIAWQYAARIDLLAILYGLAGLSAFAFYLLRHREREYLWFGVYTMLYCAMICYEAYLPFRAHGIVAANVILNALNLAWGLSSIAFYRSLLGGRRDWPYWTAVAGVSAGLVLTAITAHAWISAANTSVSIALWNELNLLFLVPLYIWILYLLIRRAVEGFPDARLLLAPAILGSLYWIVSYLFFIFQRVGWMKMPDWLNVTFHWPLPFNLFDLSDFIFLNAVVAILLLRFNRTSKQGERLAAEVEAARVAQRVLVPEEIAPVEGYAFRSAYRPAGNLSGDFFQVLPDGRGGALLALGDVSGKGLSAAMTGTMTIGALRTIVGSGVSPSDLLSELNLQVLATKQSGFVTLICALLAPDGTAVLANAGHLNPYWNGKEIEVEPGLPLGVAPGSAYPETRLQLAPGDNLTLLSDGVVEARSASGELFGFERTQAISRRPPDSIAEVAQHFGQDDDITVLSVTRAGSRLTTEAATVPLDLAPAGA